VPDWDEETQKFKKKAVAETRGEGGYCLCPPSPAAGQNVRRRDRQLNDGGVLSLW